MYQNAALTIVEFHSTAYRGWMAICGDSQIERKVEYVQQSQTISTGERSQKRN